MGNSRFYLKLSITYWVIMMVGFSDNWLYDTGQPSNSNPIFIIHGILAFIWYSLLIIQSGLVNKGKIRLHRTLGLYGFGAFLLFIPSSLAIYGDMLIVKGEIDNNGLGLLGLYVFAIILISLAYRYRKNNPEKHKILMSFGSFLMLRPAIDRVFNKVLDILPSATIMSLYLITFLVFYYIFFKYQKKWEWYMITGFGIWLVGVVYGYLI